MANHLECLCSTKVPKLTCSRYAIRNEENKAETKENNPIAEYLISRLVRIDLVPKLRPHNLRTQRDEAEHGALTITEAVTELKNVRGRKYTG